MLTSSPGLCTILWTPRSCISSSSMVTLILFHKEIQELPPVVFSGEVLGLRLHGLHVLVGRLQLPLALQEQRGVSRPIELCSLTFRSIYVNDQSHSQGRIRNKNPGFFRYNFFWTCSREKKIIRSRALKNKTGFVSRVLN